MTGWAYSAFGRLARKDVWNWFGPTDPSQHDRLVNVLYETARDKARECSALHGSSVIAFDGKKWFSGHFGLPSSALDQQRFLPKLYDHDAAGRPIHFLHGYVSDHAGFPNAIPHVDRASFGGLHEQHIIPLWDKSLAGESEGLRPQITAFDRTRATVPLAELMPANVVDMLQQAHSQGKPVAVLCDGTNNKWQALHSFEHDFRRREDMDRQLAQQRSIGSHANGAGPAPATPTEEAILLRPAENRLTWVERFSQFSKGTKIAIIGGTVAVGALIGYWAFKTKQDQDKFQGSGQKDAAK